MRDISLIWTSIGASDAFFSLWKSADTETNHRVPAPVLILVSGRYAMLNAAYDSLARISMAGQNPTKYLSLSLLVLPPLFFALGFFAQFPATPKGLQIHPSLASLPPDARSRAIYPENLYENGSYVALPFGKVRWFVD